MFKLVGLSLFMLMILSCQGHQGATTKQSLHTAEDTGKPVISFGQYEHDFGDMTEGEVMSHVFSFTNTGTGRLIIKSATASCGCTIPKYDKRPIAPGASGKLEVVFNSEGKMGRQRKTIAVRANTDPPVTLLTIYANVNSKIK